MKRSYFYTLFALAYIAIQIPVWMMFGNDLSLLGFPLWLYYCMIVHAFLIFLIFKFIQTSND